LPEVIASGMIEQILNPIVQVFKIILEQINHVTGNYGWALLIFAVLVKIVFYYPTKQQYQSMKKMQMIQPEVQKLQNLYKDDPQKLQSEQMALFAKYQINPMSGCLPLLIQMPFLWAIFTLIQSYKSVFETQTFLWIGGPLSQQFPKIVASSLAAPDIPLLLLYGYSMYLTSKLGMVDNKGMDKNQAMMTMVMPVLFTFMMWKWAFPSGLVLYWLAFNLVSIIHQSFLMREPIAFNERVEIIPAAQSRKKGGQ